MMNAHYLSMIGIYEWVQFELQYSSKVVDEVNFFFKFSLAKKAVACLFEEGVRCLKPFHVSILWSICLSVCLSISDSPYRDSLVFDSSYGSTSPVGDFSVL